MFLKNAEKLHLMGQLNETAAKLARKAIETYDFEARGQKPRKIWVAGSLPTPGESFHECKDFSDEDFDSTFKIIVGAIAPYSDFFIAETFAASRDILLTSRAARKYAPTKYLFASFAVDKRLTLVNGESVEDTVEKLEKEMAAKAPDGYSVNCSEVEYTL